MKVKLRIANYIKFVNPGNIKIGNKVLFEYKIIDSLYMSPMENWVKKIVTVDHIRSNGLFKIKEDNGQYHWDEHWIKCNYSNYKFEVL